MNETGNQTKKQGRKSAQMILTSGDLVPTMNGFDVKSQSDSSKTYYVGHARGRLVFNCTFRGDCHHIAAAVEYIRRDPDRIGSLKIVDMAAMDYCPECRSSDIQKHGIRRTKRGTVQRYKCSECGKRFVGHVGFEGMKHDPALVSRACRMASDGMSVRTISNFFRQEGVRINHATIYRWLDKNMKNVAEYESDTVVKTPDRAMVCADEAFYKYAGNQDYLFMVIDDDSRMILSYNKSDSKFQTKADGLFRDAKRRLGKNLMHLRTDGLAAYHKAGHKVFGPKVNHYVGVHLKGEYNNNKMERVNGEFRRREKTYQGLKKTDTPLIDGWILQYNYMRPHGALNGQTPAEAAGVVIRGADKWRILIQNATIHKRMESDSDAI